MDVDLYRMMGGREDEAYTPIDLSLQPTDNALDIEVERITLAAEMVAYGEEQHPGSNRSSAESASTLPDRPSMTPMEVAIHMNDAVALVAQLVRDAYNANTVGERVDRLQAIAHLNQNALLRNGQTQLLRSEPNLEDAVREMLFETGDLALTDPDVQLAAAERLVPWFDIPRDVVLRFLIATWGSSPSVNSTNIVTEAVWTGRSRQLLTRVVRPTLEADEVLRLQQARTANLIHQWILLALPLAITANAANHDYIIDTALDAFLSLGDALNPSSACLHLLISHLSANHIVVGSSGQSLMSIAKVNTATSLVYICMYPVATGTYDAAWVALQKTLPFELKDALTIAFSSGAAINPITNLLRHAINSGKSIDTDRNLLLHFRRGLRGLMAYANSYALLYGRHDLLAHARFADAVRAKHGVPAGVPVPIETVTGILLASSPSIWEWLVDELGHDDMSNDAKTQLFQALSDQIQQNNQRWM